MTLAATPDHNSTILVAYISGADFRIANVELTKPSSNSESSDRIVDLVVLQNVSRSILDNTDFGLFVSDSIGLAFGYAVATGHVSAATPGAT